MRYRTALITSAVIIAGMYGYKALVLSLVQKWVMQGEAFTPFHKALFIVAIAWTTFWWLLIPATIGFFLLIAVITSIVRYFRKKSAAAAVSTANVGQ